MITVKKIRDLPVSAASGLVIKGDALYIVADDSLYVHCYSLSNTQAEQRVRLLEGKLHEGELPADKKARKKQKPDFEALVELPAQPGLPHGALLALGSGSKPNRQQGVLVPFRDDGTLNENSQALDLTALYALLPFDDTNIEGALVLCEQRAPGDQLVLLQRGNQKNPQSALVTLSLREALQGTAVGTTVVNYRLPCIDDTPLGFTDGIALANGSIIFSAVAEQTDNSYQDGACAGAAIGLINAQGELVHCEWLAEPRKIEGIALAPGEAFTLYAVTDADDPAIPAELLEVTLPEAWFW